ncbi:translocation/assembly module TamB domain-containing protein [Colwellia sp. TT2012]|uniref:translocation/assembly module TamB domain-containing protein n=1 Tax=Colwellia sp. TT2012 TaxID=1720342 RepID=UPI000709E964|nr:translocation/assembly module TamB domain-containing protein [Colwellia sp. TT2012]
MTWRRITYKIAKWLTLLLCLVTILLTTPIGSRLTISLLNNIDGIHADYKAGSLIRDIELNSFHLNLATLDIKVKDLVAEIDFSCSWQKKLCIKALKLASFSLTYTKNNTSAKRASNTVNDDHLFVMPFAIEAQTVEINNSHIVINQTVIDIEQFTAQVDIKASQFTILQPNADKLTITFDKNSNNENNSSKQNNAENSNSTNSIYAVFSTLPKVYLPISLNIQQLFVDKLRIVDDQTQKNITLNSTLNNDSQWPYQQSHLSGTWVKSDVNITDFKTATTDFAIQQLTLNTELVPPYKINAQLVARLDKIPHWPEASDSFIELSLQGSIDDLSVNIASKGSVVLNSQGKINLTDQQLPFKLQLTADTLPLPWSLAQYGQPSSLSLDLAGDLSQQTVNLTSRLNSYGYKNAQLALTVKHQQGLITLEKLAFNEQDSNSQLNLHGHIDFIKSKEITWQLFADSAGFTLPEISLKALVFPKETNINNNSTNISQTARTDKNTEAQTSLVESMVPDVINGRLLGKIASTGTWSESHWSLAIKDTDVSGTLNNSAIIIRGDIAINQSGYFSSGDLAQGELLIAVDKDHLTLQTFRDNNWHVNGQLRISEINRWYPFASGAISSDFSIMGNKKEPVITLNSKLKNIHWQQFHSPSFEITANYQPFNNHKSHLTLKSERLDITANNDTLSFHDIAVNFSGDFNKQQLQLDWQGDLAGKLKLSGQWHNALNDWQGIVEHSALTYKDITWRNNNAFYLGFNLAKQQLFIEQHCWQGTALKVCLPDNAIMGESGDITLGINIDLSLMDELILPEEVQLKGKVTGELTAQWSPTQAIWAKANFTLSSGNIKVYNEYSEQQISQWHQGELSFEVNDGQFTSQFQLQDMQAQTLININSKITFTDDFPIKSEIVLNNFNLQPLQAVIANVVNLQGNLTAMLTVNGTIKAPIVNGSIALDNGELLLSQNPNKLTDINAEIQIYNNQAKILGQFFIKGNKATLNGDLAWQEGFTMDIDLTAKQIPLVFPPQLLMTISPALNFSLQDKVLTLSGNVDVLDGSYNIEKLPQGSITLSDDVIIVDQYGREVFKKKSGFDIKTNVSINIAKAFKVSGQGLKSHLFGQLQLKQQQKQPLQVFGNIQSAKGTYQAYGQRLTIEKGELSFNGPIDNPYFNLRATRHIKAEDIEVGLKITGLADTLAIQLFSIPTMETPEILSYLARGRGLDSGGSNSTAAASMLIGFGVTNSVGLFDRLEQLPFINNIAIDTEGEGDTTQAIISGYIGNRIYLKYGIGVYEPINELTVRLYLLNRLWLEIVSGIEQSSDLYYSFDID